MNQKFQWNEMTMGVCYYPEHWEKSLWRDDLKRMKETGISVVRIAEFSWNKVEPEEGVFTFAFFDEFLDLCRDEGMKVIFCTPSATPPAWISETYPEILNAREDGVLYRHGGRHQYNYNSKKYQELVRRVVEKEAEHYGKHPAIIGWQIDNELNCETCEFHSESDSAAFRVFLKEKYGTLDKLNDAWWTGFWGNLYTEWEQIESPSVIGEGVLHGLVLDWKRFTSEQLLNFCKEEIRIVKQHSELPVTVNMMGAFKPLNYFKWAKEVDFVSWDNYPSWHMRADVIQEGVLTAFYHTLTRSFKKAPFLMMESAPSAVQWKPENTLKKPGMHELSSLQAVAYGSDSVQYFQWRKGRGGCEKYHGAVLDHKNGENTRVFRDVTKLGARLEQISDKVKGSCNQPKVAIVFDWENWWAV